MPRALRACPTNGCPELTSGGRCTGCRAKAEAVRGSPASRGYSSAHRNRFRVGVLRKQPICTCADQGHHHGDRCWRPAVVADHYPLSRRELVDAGLDPNDPAHGRGLCKHCHDKGTAQRQPGGWNVR
jgi:5-methylcytosine-specific restriction protein A